MNLWRLEQAVAAGKLKAGAEVSVADLVAAGVIRRELDGVKLLGKGEIKSALKLTVYSATEAAIKAVEAAGGSVTVTKKAKAQAEA